MIDTLLMNECSTASRDETACTMPFYTADVCGEQCVRAVSASRRRHEFQSHCTLDSFMPSSSPLQETAAAAFPLEVDVVVGAAASLDA